MAAKNHQLVITLEAESGPEQLNSALNVAESEEICSSSEGTKSVEYDSNRNGCRSGEVEKPKKDIFKRIWSEADEVAVLKGLAKYWSEKELDPMADLSSFHDFIKDDLNMNCTQAQLKHKIRRMKSKYEKNTKKEKDGKGRSIYKRHEQIAYELSKAVWIERSGRVARLGRPRGSGKKLQDSRSAVVVQGETSCGVEEGVMRAWAELYGGEKDWKKLKVDDLEARCKHLEEQLAQTRFVLDVVKSAHRYFPELNPQS